MNKKTNSRFLITSVACKTLDHRFFCHNTNYTLETHFNARLFIVTKNKYLRLSSTSNNLGENIVICFAIQLIHTKVKRTNLGPQHQTIRSYQT